MICRFDIWETVFYLKFQIELCYKKVDYYGILTGCSSIEIVSRMCK